MNFYIVDAFTEEIFGGNPAGVVLIAEGKAFPSDGIMVKIARELRYSETAFVKQIGSNQFQIRYFTPVSEVDLCGHATIGAFGVLKESGVVMCGQEYTLVTLAGSLTVSVEEDLIFMDMAKPVMLAQISTIEKKEALAKSLGLSLDSLGMEPTLVSTGLPDILVHVKTREALDQMKPNFPALANFSRDCGAVGAHVFCLHGEEKKISQEKIVAHCRNFAPLYGIDEEAATGTANGALTFYLYKNGYIHPGEKNVFLQGESMDRPSKINTRLEYIPSIHEEEAVKIRVGGTCKIFAQGEIYL